MNKNKSTTGIITLAFILLAGCSMDVEETAGTDYLLAGYYMIAGEEVPLPEEDGSSRATAPVHHTAWNSRTFQQWIDASPTKINNYPEQGQKTYITVSAHAAGGNYFVSSRTEYPNMEDIIDYYLEEYYVEDTDSDDNWTTADVIVTPDGSTVDSKARTTMEVHFRDGSVRKEWIDYDTSGLNYTDPNDLSGYYAHFDIDGDLTIPTDPGWTPSSPAIAGVYQWSSKVYYYQKITTFINWFYKENKEVFGVRYYTLSDDDSDQKYDSSTLTFEHTLNRNVAIWSDSDWGFILDWIFGGSSGGESGETLAETVIRESISENGKKTVHSSTRIVPTFGSSFTIDNSTDYTIAE